MHKAAGRSVVLIEYNELCPPLMERFIAQGHLPNFKRFRDESQAYVTEAKERYPHLDPWIQWVTVHSGLDFEDHGIEHLNEGHKLRQKYLWDLLSDEKFRVWVCGSMSVRYDPSLNGRVLPDPWTTKVPPHPSDMSPFFKFIQQNVLEYSNDKVPLSKLDYAQFAAFMARHGLSPQTIKSIAEQLIGERVTGNGRWKRATILDKLQFDVFRHYFQKDRPHFSTFFSNSTAHFQHLYWRNMEPELFEAKPSDKQQKEYGGAILYGYKEMDAMLGRFMDLANGDTTLVFTTALSQQPCLKFEDIGGKSYYRPKDFAKFIELCGLPKTAKAAPVMSHEFYLDMGNEADAKMAEERLATVKVMGRERSMQVERKGNMVFTGCRIWESIPKDATISVNGGPTTRFFDTFYKVDGVKSGMHHPEGLLWIRRPDKRHAEHEARVPLAAVAPTILDMFSLKKPEFMRGKPLDGFAGLVA